MTVENRRKTLINILYFLVVIAIVYLSLKYVLMWFLPFVLGFVLACVVNSVSKRFFEDHLLNRKICSLVIITVIYFALLSFVVLFSSELIVESEKKIAVLPELYTSTVEPAIDSVIEWGKKILPSLGEKTTLIIDTIQESTGNMLVSFSAKAVDFFGGFVKKIPVFLIGMFFTIISSVFIVWDYDKIASFASKQVSEKTLNIILRVKQILFGSIFKLLKAYLILMIITFFELLVGFLIIGIDKPIEKAIYISLADFLPLIGISVVFVPWILVLIFQKRFYLAIGLSVIFLVITVVRNFIEPKIIGKEIGLSPIISLICFYVGLKLFGFLGAIILPIILIIFKTLNEEGIVKLWKS